jgi:hypothetical protein
MAHTDPRVDACKGMLCTMASFKAHCTFGFWKGSLLKDEANTAATRQRRMTTALEWLSEGKARNGKYERKR